MKVVSVMVHVLIVSCTCLLRSLVNVVPCCCLCPWNITFLKVWNLLELTRHKVYEGQQNTQRWERAKMEWEKEGIDERKGGREKVKFPPILNISNIHQHLFIFLRQKADRPMPKHRRQFTTWQVFRQVERRFHSRDSNRQPNIHQHLILHHFSSTHTKLSCNHRMGRPDTWHHIPSHSDRSH